MDFKNIKYLFSSKKTSELNLNTATNTVTEITNTTEEISIYTFENNRIYESSNQNLEIIPLNLNSEIQNEYINLISYQNIPNTDLLSNLQTINTQNIVLNSEVQEYIHNNIINNRNSITAQNLIIDANIQNLEFINNSLSGGWIMPTIVIAGVSYFVYTCIREGAPQPIREFIETSNEALTEAIEQQNKILTIFIEKKTFFEQIVEIVKDWLAP